MRISLITYHISDKHTTTRRMQYATNRPEIAIFSGHLGGRNWPLLLSAPVFLENLQKPLGKMQGDNLSKSSDRESNQRSFRYRSDHRGTFTHCTTQVGLDSLFSFHSALIMVRFIALIASVAPLLLPVVPVWVPYPRIN